MSNVTLYGFERSTYVIVARTVLIAKGVDFDLHDTEDEMYSETHRKRHPFGRVPVLQHRDFWLYETSAIARYVDEAFDGPALTPASVRKRALMNQWMSNLDSYFYPYMVYHLVHERVVFPSLGIEPDEEVVRAALPKCELALSVMEAHLGAHMEAAQAQAQPSGGRAFLVDDRPTLADYFLLPTLTALGLTPEGKEMLSRHPRVRAWLARMGDLPEVMTLRASLAPPKPIEHARRWVTDHRPRAR
jgi:glutathione S-transferase